MVLSSLSDRELDVRALQCAVNERAALHLVLEHMAEVQRRKSFSPRYRSIHEYTMRELKYEDRSAQRRVSAMFLMMEMPEIKDSIQNGELDLSKINSVQNFTRTENVAVKEGSRQKVTTEEKRQILQSVIGKTSREADRILASKSSNPEKFKTPDQIKAIDQNLNRVQTTLSDDDLEQIKKLKDLLAHQIPDGNLSEILSFALKTTVETIEKKRSYGGAAEEPIATEARKPSASMKRAVYKRANGACELCGSKHAPENDHIVTWAEGGKTTFDNLRLLCRNCNQREAYKKFGPRPRPMPKSRPRPRPMRT